METKSVSVSMEVGILQGGKFEGWARIIVTVPVTMLSEMPAQLASKGQELIVEAIKDFEIRNKTQPTEIGECALCRTTIFDDEFRVTMPDGSLFCSEGCLQEAQ